MWTTYNVTVTINGTNFPVSFSAGDTQAVVIEKVPVGASLSASATIGVSASGGGASLGYSSLTAATASPTTIQPGSNSITMWVQYPVECHVSSGLPAEAAITGTAPTYYSNNTAAALPAATASFVDGSTGNTMYFTGWSLTDGGTPDITGTSIPPSMYKGKLSLYATWGECALSITGAGLPAAVDPVLEEGDALTLTAVPAGFPAGAAISYSWRVVPPLSGAAPATVSGSGAHATVHPVVGSGGSATVEVTATCGTLTASAQQNVTIMVGIPDFTIQITPPSSYSSAKSTATAKKYALTNLTDAFTFTPVPAAGKSFPAGTTFSWTVKAGTMPEYTGSGGTGGAFTATPTQLSLTAESIGRTSAAATPITISCTASHTLASAGKEGTPGSASAFLLQTLPAFSIDISLDTAGYDAGNSDLTGTVPLYALVNMGKEFTFTANPGSGASFPAGTEFTWTVNGITLTAASQKGQSVSISSTAMGLTSTGTSKSAASPTEISIECTAKNTSAVADVDGTDASANVFLLTIPNITVTLSTPPAGLTTDDNGAYLVTTASLTTENFEFTASPVSGSTMPSGVKYAWTIGTTALNTASTADQTITKTLDDMGITAAPATQQTLTVKCTVSHDSLAAGTEKYNTVDVKIIRKPPIGSKDAPDALGDIVFSDGSATAYDQLGTEDLTEAVAVIFDAANKKGVGLQSSGYLRWDTITDIDTDGLAFVTSQDDGSGNWAVIQTADPTRAADAATYYPAFNYANTYSAPGYTSGWYLPAYNELCAIESAKTILNAAFGTIGSGATLLPTGGQNCWSSSSWNGDCALQVKFGDGGTGTSGTGWRYSSFFVRAVRKFD